MDFIKYIFSKCFGSMASTIASIEGVFLLIMILIMLPAQYLWALVLIIGIVIWSFKEDYSYQEKEKQRTQQFKENCLNSIIYIMRQALSGVECHFGLSTALNKGYKNHSAEYTDSGVLFYTLFYTLLPNATNLNNENREQLRGLLNSNIEAVMNDLIFDMVAPVELYVGDIKTSDGKLAICTIPIIDFKSRDFVTNHKTQTMQQSIIGGNTTNIPNTYTELKDNVL